MSTAHRSNDNGDTGGFEAGDDACAAAPLASIGAPSTGSQSGDSASTDPASAHGDTIRRDRNGRLDAENEEAIVYDDRTDDRPPE